MNCHQKNMCPPNTRPDCTLIQSYYQFYLKKLINCYNALPRNSDCINKIEISLQNCINCRIENCIQFVNSDDSHIESLITAIFFLNLLYDITTSTNGLDHIIRRLPNIYSVKNKDGNSIVGQININNYIYFLDTILSYNNNRIVNDKINCLNNNIINDNNRKYYDKTTNRDENDISIRDDVGRINGLYKKYIDFFSYTNHIFDK